jgi:hypothetical protein
LVKPPLLNPFVFQTPLSQTLKKLPPHCRYHEREEGRLKNRAQKTEATDMKKMLIVSFTAMALVACNQEKASIENQKEATKDALNQQKDAVNEAAGAAKDQAGENADAEKARIEAEKESAKAQIEADKKKADAQADAEKAKADANKNP